MNVQRCFPAWLQAWKGEELGIKFFLFWGGFLGLFLLLFYLFVLWGVYFLVLLFGFLFCCFVGIFFSSILVLSFVRVVFLLYFFFLIQGCGEGKPNNRKPLTFLQPAHP